MFRLTVIAIFVGSVLLILSAFAPLPAEGIMTAITETPTPTYSSANLGMPTNILPIVLGSTVKYIVGVCIILGGLLFFISPRP